MQVRSNSSCRARSTVIASGSPSQRWVLATMSLNKNMVGPAATGDRCGTQRAAALDVSSWGAWRRMAFSTGSALPLNVSARRNTSAYFRLLLGWCFCSKGSKHLLYPHVGRRKHTQRDWPYHHVHPPLQGCAHQRQYPCVLGRSIRMILTAPSDSHDGVRVGTAPHRHGYAPAGGGRCRTSRVPTTQRPAMITKSDGRAILHGGCSLLAILRTRARRLSNSLFGVDPQASISTWVWCAF